MKNRMKQYFREMKHRKKQESLSPDDIRVCERLDHTFDNLLTLAAANMAHASEHSGLVKDMNKLGKSLMSREMSGEGAVVKLDRNQVEAATSAISMYTMFMSISKMCELLASRGLDAKIKLAIVREDYGNTDEEDTGLLA